MRSPSPRSLSSSFQRDASIPTTAVSSPPGAQPADAAPSPVSQDLIPTGEGMELNHLWRYAGVVVLVAACAMLSAWSRIDLVETSAALGSAEARLSAATAEQARLELELASLTDPTRLERTATQLGLSSDVTVVNLTAEPQEVPQR